MIKIVWLILVFSAISFGSLLCQDEPDVRPTDPPDFVWTRLEVTPPEPRLESHLVHNPVANTFVTFGGRDENWDVVDATWMFDPDLEAWSEIETTGSPGARFMHNMTYDTRRDRVILFAGTDGTASLDDLWVFDPATATWMEVSPEGSIKPPARQLHAMTYDAHRDRLIVFGGRYEGNDQVRQLGDTWVFDFSTALWIEQTSSPSPSARDHTAMVYHPGLRLSILFGGGGPAGVLSDTWVYDSAVDRWTSMEASGAPSARDHHLLVYDEHAGSVLLVGGSFEDDRLFTYEHDHARWDAVEPAGETPVFGDHMLGAVGADRLVLSGGFRGGPAPQSTTWILKDTAR